MSKLIFGCGYLGGRVGRLWLEAGEEVYCVTRGAQRAEMQAAAGYRPLVADVTDPDSLADLPAAETVLYAVGFDRSAGRSIEEVYVEGLRNVLAALPPGTRHLIYVSSTGVYGQTDGRLVDEESPCRPRRPGGIACLAAESLLREAEQPPFRTATILRMAGIYGPGRVPRRAEIEAGRPIPSPGDGHLNLIHVEDAAEIVLRVERRTGPPRIYLVSDGAAVLRREYYAEIARQLNAAAPSYAEAEETPGRGESDKRISNARLLREFDVRLRYPGYREGLAAILHAER